MRFKTQKSDDKPKSQVGRTGSGLEVGMGTVVFLVVLVRFWFAKCLSAPIGMQCVTTSMVLIPSQ